MPTMTSETRAPSDFSARERILLTAHDLFYREGIRATGIDRVIEVSQVAKATFYRHYPSKSDLITAYLNFRHDNWMRWLRATLERHLGSGSSPLDALLATFNEWWRHPDFRGCAFINAAVELPEAVELARRHKEEMTAAFETLLLHGAGRSARARALSLAVDGAIVHAQMGQPLRTVLDALKQLAEPLLKGKA